MPAGNCGTASPRLHREHRAFAEPEFGFDQRLSWRRSRLYSPSPTWFWLRTPVENGQFGNFIRADGTTLRRLRGFHQRALRPSRSWPLFAAHLEDHKLSVASSPFTSMR